jgi:hypothetical protein
LGKIPTKEIQLGCGGMQFFTPEQLQDGQLGYSINQEGQSLVGNQEGDWRINWVVIGNESCCGDPIFVDTADNKLPVYSAPHGMGEWEPELIATSFDNFIEIIKLLMPISQGREDPVALEKNPLTDEDKENLLSQIMDINNGIDGSFWAVFMES